MSWGHAPSAGDSSAVADQLLGGIVEIASTWHAFAAIKEDGAVITWGYEPSGGDSSAVSDQLQAGVLSITSNQHAFAALKANGAVVTWGNPNHGGDSTDVADELSGGVNEIYATSHGFAATKENGEVVIWGGGDNFGNYVAPSKWIINIHSIQSNAYANAALVNNGSTIYTWGEADYGGDYSTDSALHSGSFTEIVSNHGAFAVISSNGSVKTWGQADSGGDSSSVANQLKADVTTIKATGDAFNPSAFAALKSDGSVVTWGSAVTGGDNSAVSDQLTDGVVELFSNPAAFAALKSDGSVVTWGNASKGGDNSSVQEQLEHNVTTIQSTDYGFAALKSDGSVITWGDSWGGGNSAFVTDQLSSGVKKLFANRAAFAALKADGSIVTWGSSSEGGDSSVTFPGGEKVSKKSNLESGVIFAAEPTKSNRIIPTTIEGDQASFTISNTSEYSQTFYWSIRKHDNNLLSSDFESLSDRFYESWNHHLQPAWESVSIGAGQSKEISLTTRKDKFEENLEGFDIILSKSGKRNSELTQWHTEAKSHKAIVIQDEDIDNLVITDYPTLGAMSGSESSNDAPGTTELTHEDFPEHDLGWGNIFWVNEAAAVLEIRPYDQNKRVHKPTEYRHLAKNESGQYILQQSYNGKTNQIDPEENVRTIDADIDEAGNLHTITYHDSPDGSIQRPTKVITTYDDSGREIFSKALPYGESNSYSKLQPDGSGGLLLMYGNHGAVWLEHLDASTGQQNWKIDAFDVIYGGFGFSNRPFQLLDDNSVLIAASGWTDNGDGTWIEKISLANGSRKNLAYIDDDLSYSNNEFLIDNEEVILRTPNDAYLIGANAKPIKVATPNSNTTVDEGDPGDGDTGPIDEGTVDTNAPTVQSAVIDGNQLSISFNEDIADTVPRLNNFVIKNGRRRIKATSVSIDTNSNTASLNLTRSVSAGDTITLTYKDKRNNQTSGVIEDLAGNDLAKFAALPVTNMTVSTQDSTPPKVQSAVIDGNQLTISFNEDIANTVPRLNNFVIKNGRRRIKATSVSIDTNSNIASLNLTRSVSAGDTITLTYKDKRNNQTSGVIEDLAGNDLAKFAALPVTNVTVSTQDSTPPKVQSAVINGNQLTITLNEDIASTVPRLNKFIIKNGRKRIKANSVSVDTNSDTVTLSLTKSVSTDDPITLAYKDKRSDQTSGVIEDLTGNDLAKFAAFPVTNTTSAAKQKQYLSAVPNTEEDLDQFIQSVITPDISGTLF